MRIEKKLWIALIVFGLFAVGFTGRKFNRRMGGERVSFNNTVRLETEADTAGEIKTKNPALPEEFDIPRSLLFKTTHTSVQILLDGEEIYQYGHEENAPKFMKSPGSCWHIADIPKNSAGKELEIRRTLSPSHLYSSAFVVDRAEVSEAGIPGRFILTGAGWGHGAGLCQIGAAVM